jgi:hypothetical protein
LNSGLHACKPAALPLEPLHQHEWYKAIHMMIYFKSDGGLSALDRLVRDCIWKRCLCDMKEINK